MNLKWYDNDDETPVSDDPREIIIEVNKKDDKYIFSIKGENIEIFETKKDMDCFIKELKKELDKLNDETIKMEEKINQHLKIFNEIKIGSFSDYNLFEKKLVDEFKVIEKIIRNRK